MSDDDREIDIESDEENDSDNSRATNRQSGGPYSSQADKRAHHNLLERRRRDHIKDSFTSLKDSVPSLHGEKVASRAQILKKAAEYIQFMRKKNSSHEQDIDDLKRQNNMLEEQIKHFETLRSGYSTDKSKISQFNKNIKQEDSSEDEERHQPVRKNKKLKVNS